MANRENVLTVIVCSYIAEVYETQRCSAVADARVVSPYVDKVLTHSTFWELLDVLTT